MWKCGLFCKNFKVMIIETTPQEYIIRLPISTLEPAEIERIRKELRFKELLSQLQGTPQDAEAIANELDSQWWTANQHRLVK